MLLFGHIRIMFASVALGFELRAKLRRGIAKGKAGNISSIGNTSSNNQPGRKMSFCKSLTNRVDIRYLLVGSMLPDIIDKQIGIFVPGNIQ